MKIIANYLPQFHRTKENDTWWGEGYTEWVAVKEAEPLFPGHIQPRKPLNGYYDLSRKEDIQQQALEAKKYGIDAFGIYHYWFSSDQNLLTKPAEILRQNAEIDISYLFIWDNGNWKRTWSKIKFSNDMAPMYDDQTHIANDDNGLLAELHYGDEKEWKIHFEYLLDFFRDRRYLKVNNRPVFVFFNQDNQPGVLTKMCKYWNQLATENGFDGIYFIGKRNQKNIHIMESEFLYQPIHNGWFPHNFPERVIDKFIREYQKRSTKLKMYSYDKIWKRILMTARKEAGNNVYYGAFVRYDDTPRRGNRGRVIAGESPDKFERYFTQLMRISKQQNKDFIFLTAWNEWGEGAYLEPDETNGYAYLEAVRNAVDAVASETEGGGQWSSVIFVCASYNCLAVWRICETMDVTSLEKEAA